MDFVISILGNHVILKINIESYSCNRPWMPMGLGYVEDPTFLDNRLIDGGEVVSLKRQLRSNPRKLTGTRFYIRGWVNLRAIARLERIGTLKNNDLIGNRTRNLPACSILPQRTKLPHTPSITTTDYKKPQQLFVVGRTVRFRKCQLCCAMLVHCPIRFR
jgi:hypothetical protein